MKYYIIIIWFVVVFVAILFAVNLTKQNICDIWGNDEEKNECYYDVAVADNKAGLCQKIVGDMRDSCYQIIAWQKNDQRVCNYIESNEVRAGCITEIAKKDMDVKKCEGNGACITAIASDQDNFALCGYIKNESEKDSCYYSIAVNVRKMDYRICSVISDNSAILLDGSTVKDDCYRTIAVQLEDDSICDFIFDDEVKEICYSSINV